MKRESTLLDTYLDYHNLTLKSKNDEPIKRDGMPFMPMLLMDAMNLLYEDYVKPLPFKHRQKQLRSRWHLAYTYYVTEEFMAFNDDEKSEICDLMDKFDDYIHNKIEMFRVATMSRFMQYDLEIRLTLSAILACNALAQSAQILYKAQRKKINPHIQSIEIWSHKLLNEYASNNINRATKENNLNEFQDIISANKNLCKSIIEFAQKCEF